MDLLKKAKDRAQQSIGEAVGSATKTELDKETSTALVRLDDIHSELNRLINALNSYIHPDPTLNLFETDAPNKAENLGFNLRAFAGKMKGFSHAGAADTMKAFGDAYCEERALMGEKRVDMDACKNKKKHEESELKRLEDAFNEQQLKVRAGIEALEKKFDESYKTHFKALAEIDAAHFKKCAELMDTVQTQIA